MERKKSRKKKTDPANAVVLEFKVLEQIKECMADFTPRQRAVGEYIMKNPESLAFLSIVELSQKAGVSQATVVRFSNALGYAGYSQLSGEIRQAIQFEYGSADRFKLGRTIEGEPSPEGDGSLFSRVISSEIENLIALAQNIRSSQFNDCVDRVLSADRLGVIGCLSSMTLAVHMNQMLIKILPHTDLFTHRDIATASRLSTYGKNSLVFLISFPRYPKEGIEIAATARKRGAHVVVITNSQLSPAVKVADQTFFINVDVPSFVDGYAAPLAFINALATEIGVRRPAMAQKALNNFDEFVADHGLFLKQAGEWRPRSESRKGETEEKDSNRARRKK